MAEAEGEIRPVFDFSDPNINTVYANDTAAIVGDTEINLFFSDSSRTPEGSQKKISTRVIISHANFIRMMDFWVSRYEFLETMYEGMPPSLEDFQRKDPEKHERAIQQFLLGRKPKESPDAK